MYSRMSRCATAYMISSILMIASGAPTPRDSPSGQYTRSELHARFGWGDISGGIGQAVEVIEKATKPAAEAVAPVINPIAQALQPVIQPVVNIVKPIVEDRLIPAIKDNTITVLEDAAVGCVGGPEGCALGLAAGVVQVGFDAATRDTSSSDPGSADGTTDPSGDCLSMDDLLNQIPNNRAWCDNRSRCWDPRSSATDFQVVVDNSTAAARACSTMDDLLNQIPNDQAWCDNRNRCWNPRATETATSVTSLAAATSSSFSVPDPTADADTEADADTDATLQEAGQSQHQISSASLKGEHDQGQADVPTTSQMPKSEPATKVSNKASVGTLTIQNKPSSKETNAVPAEASHPTRAQPEEKDNAIEEFGLPKSSKKGDAVEPSNQDRSRDTRREGNDVDGETQNNENAGENTDGAENNNSAAVTPNEQNINKENGTEERSVEDDKWKDDGKQLQERPKNEELEDNDQ